MEEGKLALASKEYEKAVSMFKLAYNENPIEWDPSWNAKPDGYYDGN